MKTYKLLPWINISPGNTVVNKHRRAQLQAFISLSILFSLLSSWSQMIAVTPPSSRGAASGWFTHRWLLSFNYVRAGVCTSPDVLNCQYVLVNNADDDMSQKCICVLFSLSETDFYMDQFPSLPMEQYDMCLLVHWWNQIPSVSRLAIKIITKKAI